MSKRENKTDVIIVGAGPAGIAAAITVARAGFEAIVIERGTFAGSKNVFGGAVYTESVKEIFPDFETSAPLERKNIEHKFTILGEDDSTVISYRKSHETPVSYTVMRGKFDRWMAEEAKKEGVILVEETVVRELIVENEKVIGVKTELEDYYANIVILADGVNSLLAKQIGLREDIKPKDVAVSVKEVIKLDKQKINDRFLINDDEGCIYELFGGSMLGKLGLGFIYTNKDSVSIGLGITLDELDGTGLKPYELLEKIKQHPTIAPLIKDGEVIEYSAHLIPEGGYKKMPTLSGAGVMVTGDAAMLVNNMHWEGTNLAMVSGKIAGETAVVALNKEDFSENSLSRYQEKLEGTFVIKDLHTYRNLMDVMHDKKEVFMDVYFKKINAFFEMFTSVNGVPKRQLYRKFIFGFIKERGFCGLLSDAWAVFKLVWSILIK
ncbi:FAD-dependent oxidoreductase [bacterium]|nr:FAD-dependent oxidoreductase [bacterium]